MLFDSVNFKIGRGTLVASDYHGNHFSLCTLSEEQFNLKIYFPTPLAYSTVNAILVSLSPSSSLRPCQPAWSLWRPPARLPSHCRRRSACGYNSVTHCTTHTCISAIQIIAHSFRKLRCLSTITLIHVWQDK